jgi:hypothetical protein
MEKSLRDTAVNYIAVVLNIVFTHQRNQVHCCTRYVRANTGLAQYSASVRAAVPCGLYSTLGGERIISFCTVSGDQTLSFSGVARG